VEAPPVYPGATEVENVTLGPLSPSFPKGLTAKLYFTTASVDEVVNWYRAKMSEEGWTKTADETPEIGGFTFHFLTFTKWDGIAWVAVVEEILIPGTSFWLIWGPKEEMPAEIPQL
jgi:hypothetical protein